MNNMNVFNNPFLTGQMNNQSNNGYNQNGQVNNGQRPIYPNGYQQQAQQPQIGYQNQRPYQRGYYQQTVQPNGGYYQQQPQANMNTGYNQQVNNPNTLYGAYGQGRQAMPVAQPTRSINGIIVDNSWTNLDIYSLEDPAFMLKNYYNTSKGSLLPLVDNKILKDTTIALLNKMKSDTDMSEDMGIRFTSTTGAVVDFKMMTDPVNRTRVVFLDIPNRNNSYNPLITTIDKLLGNKPAAYNNTPNPQYSGASYENSYAICFNKMVTALRRSGESAAQLYIDIVISALDYINSVVSHHIKRLPNGQYAMSASLADILTNGNISIAGININPILSVDSRGELSITMLLDFAEDITVRFKGDMDYSVYQIHQQ